MEVDNGARTRRSLDSSNTKLVIQKKKTPPAAPPLTLRKVQIVYYLSRNGQLEHPHFMELSHPAHHPLRLKHVMERLILLRGKGMPSQYSWSCKRSYKTGYVWNDLSENDVVYPTESESGSAEYILKGSEILLLQPSSSSSSEITQQRDVSFRAVAACPKRTTQQTKRHPEPQEVVLYGEEEEEENYDDEYEEEDDDNNNNNDDKEKENVSLKQTTTELTHRNSAAAPKPRITHSVATESLLSRNSLLLQLLACGGGGSAAATRRRITSSSPAVETPYGEKEKANNNNNNNNNSSNKLYKGVVCNGAAAAAASTELNEEMIIRCMSENPRFGNLQAEEKEYFSGSIVDSMISTVRSDESTQLKKSTSCNEERSLKNGLGDAEDELQKEHGADDIKKREKDEIKKREKSKCIPMRMRSSCITRQPYNNK